jgi:mono/diheme cytochrome c family protein
MKRYGLERSLALIAAASALCVFSWTAAAQAQEVTWAELQPVLQARCVICHSGPGAPLGLHLDSLHGLLKGSQNGPVVQAGDPSGSELIRRLRGISTPRMPLTGPPFLSEAEVSLFERWIMAAIPAVAPAVAQEPAAIAAPAPGEVVTYTEVAPLFTARCVKCHADNGLMGPAPEGYRLTSYEAAISAADRVRIVPGQPAASEIVRRLRGQSLPRMPFDGPPYFSDAETALVAVWVEQGARSAAGTPATVPHGARVRLQGRLTGQWQLDELPLIVTGATRIDKSPRTGDFVEVRGRLDAGGGVVAERIRARK